MNWLNSEDAICLKHYQQLGNVTNIALILAGSVINFDNISGKKDPIEQSGIRFGAMIRFGDLIVFGTNRDYTTRYHL